MAVTVHTMRIDTLMENYGFIQLYWTVTKQQVCTFKYRTGEMTYGNEMQDVMPNIFNDRYTSAIYNPVENLMIFRREYKTEQQAKNALNLIKC